MSPKQQNESFRSYIIKLCNVNYNKCRDAYINKYPNLKYPDEYYKDLEKIIKNTERNEKYTSKHPWPDNLLGDYETFSNDQLIIIYQYVFLVELPI